MEKIKIFLVALSLLFLPVINACEEEPFRIENYGSTGLTAGAERKVICVKTGTSTDALVKFELNGGENLTSVYWQKNAAYGYLFDFHSGKLFVDAPSGIFFCGKSDFYSSLARDVDWEKVKNSLTREIAENFCREIDGAVAKIAVKKPVPPGLAADLEKVKQGIREIDLEAWYRAVESERNKIHALGLEYCVGKEQAEILLSKVSFDLDYRQIVKRRFGDRYAVSRKGLAVCIGENHPEDADKYEAIRAVEELRSLGFNYLLVECVLAADQKILDDYSPDDAAKRAALLDYLNRNGWASQSLNSGGKGSVPYLEMIDRAKRLGYKVVAISPPQRDDIEALRYNYWMALNVAGVFKKEPGARVIVFTGATHAFPNYLPPSDVVFEGYLMRQDIPDILKKTAGVESIVFECIGGLKDADIRNYLNPEKVLEKYVERKGLDGERFFIPVPPEISTLSPEGEYYYIHSPQQKAYK